MSEEILKALTQLFAIITKQDGGVTDNERAFVINFFKQELDQDSVNEYIGLYDKFSDYSEQKENAGVQEEKKQTLTSVRDSVRTLGLCKKINKTLQQKQKVVVLIKTLELVGSDKNFTPQRMEIINTISSVFNISKEEYKEIELFITVEEPKTLKHEDFMVVDAFEPVKDSAAQHFHAEINGHLVFKRIPSVDMFFVKYLGDDPVVLNGFIMKSNRVYLFSHGSTIKTPQGHALYYSDLVSHFNSAFETTKMSFLAKINEFKFPNGGIGLRDVEIAEGPGKLIGIMGASGAGKTTLLNVLAGIEVPSDGFIRINGFDIHKEKEQIEGIIGYVSQDDLLIEELTVYQNLYYNAKLCFSNMSEEELDNRVMTVLESLGLDQRKDLKVGNPLEKTISGGQRKRLNIALELIREPGVLFVDEPTSGLSSRDSENVIDLLKELSLKGKLIFVVIHQPSSDIYKMFDKMYIMDTGGYPVFYGNPIEAVTYFKTVTNQVDKQRGQCETCGNVNPEQIFNIIEARVVDEYGQLTNKRKINPLQWNDQFKGNFKIEKIEEVTEKPPKALHIPSRIKQMLIFITRDVLSKLSNKQYLLINLLEAPVLALILAFVIRYKNSPDGEEYYYRFNENIPAFLLMAIVVVLFMGLTVSAEEIIRDRKILKRESFLNLSWNSYLLSKLSILFTLSAIQSLSFVLVGDLILEMPEMIFSHWLVLFTTACLANVLGLNISSAFNSAVTVYVIIPLLLIPQMILSGLLFSFDKLNEHISAKGKVPVVADIMASRWAYEAIAVDQFINNSYEAPYYDLEKMESMADFKSAYVVEELKKKRKRILENLENNADSLQQLIKKDLNIIKESIENDYFQKGLEGINLETDFTIEKFPSISDKLVAYLEAYKTYYQKVYNETVAMKEKKMMFYENNNSFYNLGEYKNKYYNESLADLVTNISVKDRILEHEGKLIQQINPIFKDPKPSGLLDYRTQFFVPTKHFLGIYMDTYYFNIIIIWIMSLFLYFTLYFEVLAKLIDKFGKIKIPRKKQ
ncbi:MAG: ATP-binding cassette domain-containing protein [Cyclobacteriaceae bacterium]|nr:ATP-binding cassette domain-containing protein [Cyclobacteriaceae bacterium]